MNIGIIGSGKIGGTAAKLFAGVNHQVTISNSRGPASLSALVGPLGSRVRAATVEEAAQFGDAVLVAIPLGKYRTLPAAALAGKVVIDAMNYYPQRDGQIDLGALTSSELVAQYLRGARVVKAFNTMYFETLANQGRPSAPIDERLALFVAGDDAAAKTIVSRLIEEIGFAPIDTGTLHDGGRLQQPGSPIYNHPMAAPEARAAVRAGR
ncbi:MAG TPA: NAD(P)-binding domain-containing protein [bacterium]|nr:NAD(P)-binding domain-containing protein [bacterium]